MLDDIFLTIASLDIFEKLFGVFWNLRHADWRGARKRKGATGIAAEAMSATIGNTSWRFEVPRGQGLSGTDIEHILNRYGITVWNRGVNRHSYFFNVKKRQARWAEYLIMQKSIKLISTPFDERNAGYPERHPMGWMPRPWSESGTTHQPPKPSSMASFRDPILGTGRKSSSKPLEKVNKRAQRRNGSNHMTKEGDSQRSSSHHKSVPARTPGGWLEQLDALWKNL